MFVALTEKVSNMFLCKTSCLQLNSRVISWAALVLWKLYWVSKKNVFSWINLNILLLYLWFFLVQTLDLKMWICVGFACNALLPLSHVDRNFSHTFPMLTPWANSFVSAKLPRFFPRQATTTDQSGKAEEAKTKFAKCCLQCIRQHHGCSHAVKFSIPFFS